jgi:meso-butanediol dehydrogenase/(S,S)-butanediol dehydrogenase/diacetyl reductase
VANAGICQVKPFVEITTEDWDNIFATNLRGVFLCYRDAAQIMIKQNKGGKIIGACSTAGYLSFPMLSHYSTTKWGVRGLTQVAAMELAKFNSTVNSYRPG